MPEPVVIIGPAAGPAGPVSGEPDSAASAPAPDSPGAAKQKNRRAAPAAALRILGSILSLLKRVLWALAGLLGRVARRYPRHSLAAAASILILGAILYSQSGSKSARRDLTNKIEGNPSPQTAESKASAGAAKSTDAASPTKVAADGNTGGSDKEKPAASAPASPPKPESKESTIAQNDPSPSSVLPAPKPQSTEQDAHTGALAQTDTQDKNSQKADAAPAPAPPSSDPPLVPLPAPAGEVAKATLLAAPLPHETGSPPPAAPPSSLAKNEKHPLGAVVNGSPSTDSPVAAAPPPSGEQVAGAKPMPDVPDDLLVPEGATKAADDKPKDTKGAETVVAAATNLESKPLDAQKKTEAAANQPVEPGSKAPVEPIPLPGEVALTPAAAPEVPGEPKAAAANSDPAPNLLPEINQPGEAAKEDARAQTRDKVAGETHEASPKQGDSGAPPLRVPVPVPVGGGTDKESDAEKHAKGGPDSDQPQRQASETAVGTNQKNGMTTAGPTEAKPAPRASREVDEAGWISVPNSGKVPFDPSEKAVGDPASGSQNGDGAAASGADSRFHAKRDMEFESEPTQAQLFEAGSSEASSRTRPRAGALANEPQPRAASHSERVEATEHVVERKENYWSISRQYWGSARYYVALWKANSARYPDINVLHVGDVIVVPAIEDLDPDYILPPGKSASPEWLERMGISRRGSQAARAGTGADSAEETASSSSAASRSSGKVGLASRSGNVPARRASLSDPELDLPDSRSSSRVDRSSPYKGRSSSAASTFDGDGAGDEPESRTTARPRSANAASAGSPVYRVRTNDTLRSIARDMLGNSRRADEILELNRGVIDDPSQLVVGQMLELPEDARTAVRRRATTR